MTLTRILNNPDPGPHHDPDQRGLDSDEDDLVSVQAIRNGFCAVKDKEVH